MLSPTYARTHFKVQDTMVNPNVNVECQKIIHPKVVYDTKEKRLMDTRREELNEVDDAKKKAMLQNRLEIWGSLHKDDAEKFKNTACRRTQSQIRVAAQIALMKQ